MSHLTQEVYKKIYCELVNALKEDPTFQKHLTKDQLEFIEQNWRRKLEESNIFVNMNIDITNYLSTIKHISNGTQFAKNSVTFPKHLEALQGRVLRNEGESDSRSASRLVEESSRGVKVEQRHDIFMDEASEVEEQPEPLPLQFSPNRQEVREDVSVKDEHNVS